MRGTLFPLAPMGYHYESCPVCRGYTVESSWCGHCQGRGYIVVKDPTPTAAREEDGRG